jgi:hypothetical protein
MLPLSHVKRLESFAIPPLTLAEGVQSRAYQALPSAQSANSPKPEIPNVACDHTKSTLFRALNKYTATQSAPSTDAHLQLASPKAIDVPAQPLSLSIPRLSSVVAASEARKLPRFCLTPRAPATSAIGPLESTRNAPIASVTTSSHSRTAEPKSSASSLIERYNKLKAALSTSHKSTTQ